MRPRTILFDLDGTLTDSLGLIVHCCQETFRVFLDREVLAAEIAPQIGRSLFALFDDYDSAQRPEMVAFYRRLYSEQHDAWVRLFPGVEEMLSAVAAQGISMGIVTSKSLESAQRALDGFGLRPRLATLVTYDDTERHKPDPAPLLLACERLQQEPAQCWYIGDAIHDIHAAQAAGMTAVAALWGASEPERLRAQADRALVSPQELADKLQCSHEAFYSPPCI